MAVIDIRNEIMKILEQDEKIAGEVTREVLKKTGKEAAQKLRNSSKALFEPSGKHDKKYYQGWTSTTEEGRLQTETIVYGKSGTSQLAHLLEYGHVSRNGTGRTFKPVQGKEHIAPVERWATETAHNEILRKLTGKV